MANPIIQQINAELESLQKELDNFKSTVEYLNAAEEHVKKSVQTVNLSKAHFNKKTEELKNTYDSFIELERAVNDMISKLSGVNFPERLDRIESTVKDTITYLNDTRKATLEELQKASETIIKADFDGRFKKLDDRIQASVKSNEVLADTIDSQDLPGNISALEKNVNKKLESSISDLQRNTEQIATKTANSVLDLNLPIRMDKLDANISGILTAIHNVQGRVESVHRSISENLKEAEQSHTSRMQEFQEEMNVQLSGLKELMKAYAEKQQTYSYVTWGIILISAVVLVLLLK